MLAQFRRLITKEGLLLPLMLLVVGLFAFLANEMKLGVICLMIGFGCGLGWYVTRLITHRNIIKPLARLVADSEALVTKDNLILTDALAALAQGNLTTRITLGAQSLTAASSFPEVNQLTSLFNTIIAQIHDSAKEFNAVTDEPCERLFYVGADPYLEGHTCGEMMGQILNGRGQVAIIIGSFSQTSHQLRSKGFEIALRKKYPNVQILETVENQDSADICHLRTQELIKRHPNLAGIYVAEGGTPSALREHWLIQAMLEG
ncbi:MAG: substrate-binding domain-containing protein [Anaerolineales bacterium]|nr:substrate-binding domain-containing protein [Anaerolineales bacterium]